MEKTAQKKSSSGHFLSLLGKVTVLLLSLLINNLLGLSVFIHNSFKRHPKSGQDAFGASEPESSSSKDDEKWGKRKHKSCLEHEKTLLPSHSSEEVVCKEHQKNKKLKKETLNGRENVESLPKENRKKANKNQDKKPREFFQDVHDATVQKRRKTLNSGESNTPEKEDKGKSRKRKSEWIETEQIRQEKHHKKDVSKNEAGSRRRKREDRDPADKDRVQPPSKNLRGQNHIIYGPTRIGNLPFDVKEEELYQQFLGILPLNQLLTLFEILTEVKA